MWCLVVGVDVVFGGRGGCGVWWWGWMWCLVVGVGEVFGGRGG